MSFTENHRSLGIVHPIGKREAGCDDVCLHMRNLIGRHHLPAFSCSHF